MVTNNNPADQVFLETKYHPSMTIGRNMILEHSVLIAR